MYHLMNLNHGSTFLEVMYIEIVHVEKFEQCSMTELLEESLYDLSWSFVIICFC